MSDGRVGSNHQIKIHHHRSRIQKRSLGFIETIAQFADGKRHFVQLFHAAALLQADQMDSRQVGQGAELPDMKRALPVLAVRGLSLPNDPDPKAIQVAEPSSPVGDALRRHGEVGDVGRHRVDRRAQDPRQGQQRNVDVERRQGFARDEQSSEGGACFEQRLQGLRALKYDAFATLVQ